MSESFQTNPSSKLRAVIVGAGIAGLSVAAFLRRCPQYDVTIYERRSADFKETSAGLGVHINGINVLKRLGIGKEEIRAGICSGYRTYNVKEEQMSKSQLDHGPDGDGRLWLVFRQDLKNILLEKVTGNTGEGDPIHVIYGCQIASIEPEAGVVKFDDGTSITADLIIGADGIHSKVREAVIPPSYPAPVPCGLSLYRFVLPMDVVKDAVGDESQWPVMLNQDEGTFVTVIAAGDAGNRHVVMYPYHDYEQMNIAFAVPDWSLKRPSELEYSWNSEGGVAEMVEGIQEFPPWLKRVFSRAPRVALFQVHDQEPLPTYVKCRTVLIGDAAHAMVPYQGQGANQALEDVEGINDLFADVLDRDHIPSLLQTWDSIRRPRASEIQRGSRTSQGKIATKGAAEAILSVKPSLSMKEAMTQLQRSESTGV
ncbi:hypothetical protein N7540_003320 [Penicillium herquei]|nr:hypothetical protein N7540_003320 [Penicillium herquei]